MIQIALAPNTSDVVGRTRL